MKRFEYKSAIGKVKMIDVVYGNPTPGTYGDYFLLKDYYRKHEDINEWRTRVLFSIKYLRTELYRTGNLICAYCGKEHLQIETPTGITVPKNIKATIDHFIPISQYGDILDKNNIVVSCAKCNSKKESKIYPLETLKYASKEDVEKISNYIKKFNLKNFHEK